MTGNSVAEPSRSQLALDRSWTRTNKSEQRPHVNLYLSKEPNDYTAGGTKRLPAG